MDHDGPPPNRRKLKFAPKPASQRKPKLPTPKLETGDGSKDEDYGAEAQLHMNRFNARLNRQLKRAEKKVGPAEVAFGAPPSGAAPLPFIRKFGPPKSEATNPSSRNEEDNTPEATADPDAMQIDKGATFPRKAKKYKEPFDYENSYYPTTLPLREPYSGDPEVLDEVEFGKAAMESEYDEKSINHAAELGLLEESDERKMLLFQLPQKLPLAKMSNDAKGKGKVGTLSSSSDDLAQLPAGYMGKMLVYKSGAVKLKIGDVLYDVTQGSECMFAQQVAAIDTATKQFSLLGSLEKHAVVSANVDSLLDSAIDLE